MISLHGSQAETKHKFFNSKNIDGDIEKSASAMKRKKNDFKPIKKKRVASKTKATVQNESK